MGWKLNELITCYSLEEDHQGRDALLIGNSISDIIVLKQDENEIVLDPLQIKDIYDILIQRGII